MRIEWNEGEYERMLQDPALTDYARQVGDAVAQLAREMAPRRTGAGAASLQAEAEFLDGQWEIAVGADQLHAYMRFPDRGTKFMPAQRFMENAAARYGTAGR